jgi:hypothetical protein
VIEEARKDPSFELSLKLQCIFNSLQERCKFCLERGLFNCAKQPGPKRQSLQSLSDSLSISHPSTDAKDVFILQCALGKKEYLRHIPLLVVFTALSGPTKSSHGLEHAILAYAFSLCGNFGVPIMGMDERKLEEKTFHHIGQAMQSHRLRLSRNVLDERDLFVSLTLALVVPTRQEFKVLAEGMVTIAQRLLRHGHYELASEAKLLVLSVQFLLHGYRNRTLMDTIDDVTQIFRPFLQGNEIHSTSIEFSLKLVMSALFGPILVRMFARQTSFDLSLPRTLPSRPRIHQLLRLFVDAFLPLDSTTLTRSRGLG